MSDYTAAIVRYEKPLDSVRRAVELCIGFKECRPGSKVFIKPNIVLWTREVLFPKFGVITTSRVVEDIVVLLKEHGVDDITIGEGSVTRLPKDRETAVHAFTSLGYKTLEKRYGVKCRNIFERPFEEVDLGGGVVLNYNADALNSDFVVNLPVLKTHAQTTVSVGIKNLKGLIDIESRKKCHNADPEKNLHYHIARLADKLPPSLTLVDGIYTLERGPSIDGKAHRSNILVASTDVLSADLTGSRLLGHDPADVPHLVQAAKNRNRPHDLSDVEVMGERIEDLAKWHMPAPDYNDDGTLPLPLAKMGIQGLYYHKYDLTMCTYCSGINGAILSAIAMAWKGEPWDEVEVLTGKAMVPTPGKKKTILVGQCMYQANKDHPHINELIAIKGCPPQPKTVVKAFRQAGIELDPGIFDNIEQLPAFFNRKYEGKPEFEEAHFQINEDQ